MNPLDMTDEEKRQFVITELKENLLELKKDLEGDRYKEITPKRLCNLFFNISAEERQWLLETIPPELAAHWMQDTYIPFAKRVKAIFKGEARISALEGFCVVKYKKKVAERRAKQNYGYPFSPPRNPDDPILFHPMSSRGIEQARLEKLAKSLTTEPKTE